MARGGFMQYLALVSLDDESAKIWVDKWINEAGGKISLSELREKYEQRFSHWAPVIFTEQEWDLYRAANGYVPYKLEGEMVSPYYLI